MIKKTRDLKAAQYNIASARGKILKIKEQQKQVLRRQQEDFGIQHQMEMDAIKLRSKQDIDNLI